MQMTVEISTKVYEELRKSPLFFVKLKEDIHTDENGRECDYSLWKSVNSDYSISFPAQNFGNRVNGCCLCLVERATYVVRQDLQGKTYTDENWVNMVFRDVSNSVQDYRICLDSCISRSQNKEDKYYYLEILWLLDKTFIDVRYLTEAINQYDSRSIPYILNILRQIGQCLSVKKQNILKKVCTSLNGQYNVYMPQILTEAVHFLQKETEPDKKNLFQLIDEFFEDEFGVAYADKIGKTNNPLLQLVCWLSNETKLADYNTLIPLFALVSEETRLNIVKRYFYDVRSGNTTFDVQLIQQFVDNKFDDFIRYRYCTETPSEKVILTVPFLCDSIITLYNSKGRAFQTFDGILDFAITHCDQAHPNINFGLERIIPTCEHSAVYNTAFKGFIDYQLIRKLNTSKLSDENLLITIRSILDKYGQRLSYPICKYDKDKKIETTILEKCKSVFRDKTTNGSSKLPIQCAILNRACNKTTDKSLQKSDAQCPGIGYKLYEDKWLVDEKEMEILKTFASSDSSFRRIDSNYYVDIQDVSVDTLRKYVNSLPQKYQMVGEDEFLVPSYKKETYDLFLINTLSEILRMRIVPQKGALVGLKFDIFGYWKEIYTALPDDEKRNTKGIAFEKALPILKEKESNEVYRRTVASLKKELKTNEYNGEYFELKYDRQQLIRLISRYYFKETLKDDDDDTRRNFLTLSYTGNFKPYCAPTLSETNNPAIDLPFFWCRGKECFHNNLTNQTLAEENDWHKYKLYHMVEIIGFPKLHMTLGGYEPDNVVREFIAITNKVMQKYKRLKCRGCGHLMFTDKSGGFNRHNYYSCINPNCPEARIPVYLNYCFKCKKGLIDSRDSKRCPNGWYICPTCLACCDDEQYERQAQRFRIINRPVPERIARMLGLGHNDKGKYFCPDCGGPIEFVMDERYGEERRGCPRCHKFF